MGDWMTTRELAAYSRLGVSTIKRLIAASRNRLPSHYISGRRLFRREEYEQWAERQGRAERRARAKLKLPVEDGLRERDGSHGSPTGAFPRPSETDRT